MRPNFIATVVASAIVSAVALTAAPQTAKPPKGFTSLFDGKDLSGWRGRQPNYDPAAEAKLSKDELAAKQAEWNTARDAHWKVDTAKREIVSDGQSPHLATAKDYGDFEFYVDWLMVSPNGDSGVYLRGYPQVQVWDPGQPARSDERRPEGLGRAVERQRRQPRQVAAGQGRQSRRPVEHVHDQDDRLAGLDLAERQADGRSARCSTTTSTARPRSWRAARSSSRRTVPRSASATSSCARSRPPKPRPRWRRSPSSPDESGLRQAPEHRTCDVSTSP